MMKRLLLFMVFTVLVLALTACPSEKPKDTKDTKAPTVTITSAAESTTAKYKLEGTATDDVKVTKVQYAIGNAARQDLTLNGGKFSKEITLSAESTTITVYATDDANNEGKKSITVQFKPTPAAGTEFSQGSAEALNTAVNAVMTRDYSQVQKFASRYVPPFLNDIVGVNAQSLARQTSFNGCPTMTSASAGMLVDFDVPACTITRNGVKLEASGKAVVTFTQGTFAVKTTAPVKVRASKGQEFFEVTLQGQFGYSYTSTKVDATSKSSISFAAKSQQTGDYSYTLTIDAQGNATMVRGQDAQSSGMDAELSGTFGWKNNTNSSSHNLVVSTPTPFQVRMGCSKGPIAGKIKYVLNAKDTFELSYTECGKYQITHNGQAIAN